MIYFATCSRGFEQFVKEELLKMQCVNKVLKLSEGKILFCVCACKNDKNCKRCHVLSEVLPNIYYQELTLENVGNLLPEFDALFSLKLVEKVYLLLVYKSILLLQDIEKVEVSDILTAVRNINFESCRKIIEQLVKSRANNEREWIKCSNYTFCPASCSQQQHNQWMWQRKHRLCNLTKDNADDKSKETLKNEPVEFQNIDKSQNFTFRVSCRIRGRWKQRFYPNSLSHQLSRMLCNMAVGDCTTDNPALDIYINLNDEHLLIGSSLSTKPLSLRAYIPHITLRSTVCHIMLQLAGFKEGDSILDPMCGTATILLEAAMNWKNLRIIGCDIDDDQLTSAKCNLRNVGHAELIRANAKASIDAIICDFPFGKKYKQGNNSQEVLFNIIHECWRVVKKQSKIVLLISPEQLSSIQSLQEWINDEIEVPLYDTLQKSCESAICNK